MNACRVAYIYPLGYKLVDRKCCATVLYEAVAWAVPVNGLVGYVEWCGSSLPWTVPRQMSINAADPESGDSRGGAYEYYFANSAQGALQDLSSTPATQSKRTARRHEGDPLLLSTLGYAYVLDRL